MQTGWGELQKSFMSPHLLAFVFHPQAPLWFSTWWQCWSVSRGGSLLFLRRMCQGASWRSNQCASAALSSGSLRRTGRTAGHRTALPAPLICLLAMLWLWRPLQDLQWKSLLQSRVANRPSLPQAPVKECRRCLHGSIPSASREHGLWAQSWAAHP